MLDMNPIGQLVGVGPQVALVTTYGSHPIVTDMKGNATGFPLSRSLEIKEWRQDHGREAVRFLGHQLGHHQTGFAERQSE